MSNKQVRVLSVWADILGVVGFGVAVFLACTNFPALQQRCFDYQAILVGIIAAIFTLVVGWNIHQVVDWKDRHNEIEELSAKLKRETTYLHNKADYNTAVCDAYLSQLYANQFSKCGKDAIKQNMLNFGLKSLKNLSNFPDTELEIRAVSESLLNGLSYSSDIALSKSTIEDLLVECGKLNSKNIPQFNKIKNAIGDIRIAQ